MKNNAVYLLCLISTISLTAQENINKTWSTILHLNSGYSLSTKDWEYTHPYILGNGGSFTGRITGTYEESYSFLGGLELSKDYFGLQANLGIFPAKFSIKEQVDPGLTQARNDIYSYTAIYIEAEGILFPIGNQTDKISPFLKIGLAGMTTVGDIKNNLLSLSGCAGTRLYISGNVGMDFSFKFRYMLLYNVKLADEISAANGVSLSSLIVNVGVIYKF
ncbi:hypothetical protein LJE86_02180 [bacterium BMS3Abin03]|nr:hypothetical protein [bacterium BMS3Abin03]MCG6959916.1 hypothetical protein [bacterium BMS3Abin03]